LGVDQLAVVITKLDTCDYDEQRFQHIRWVPESSCLSGEVKT